VVNILYLWSYLPIQLDKSFLLLRIILVLPIKMLKFVEPFLFSVLIVILPVQY